MASSGLQEMLELIYAPNAVVHMLSGKAIAPAIRVHFIVDVALNALMLKSVFNAPCLKNQTAMRMKIQTWLKQLQGHQMNSLQM